MRISLPKKYECKENERQEKSGCKREVQDADEHLPCTRSRDRARRKQGYPYGAQSGDMSCNSIPSVVAAVRPQKDAVGAHAADEYVAHDAVIVGTNGAQKPLPGKKKIADYENKRERNTNDA